MTAVLEPAVEPSPAVAARAWCAQCLGLVEVRGDGTFVTHRDRGGVRCRLSHKQSPEWLRLLVDGQAAGRLAPWPIERVAEYLDVLPRTAAQVLRRVGVAAVGRAGRRLLYDPAEVEAVRAQRARPSSRWIRRPVPAGEAKELRALYAAARTVNGATPLDSPARAASLELTRRLVTQHLAGTSFDLLDATIGARPGTCRRRVVRHQAHGTLPPSVTPYRGVVSGAAAPTGAAGHTRLDTCTPGVHT